MNRRGFLTGLISALAAPAIVRIDNIMPVRQSIVIPNQNAYLTMQMITREAIQLFKNSNAFIQNIDSQYDEQFHNVRIGSRLRIKLPTDYVVNNV